MRTTIAIISVLSLTAGFAFAQPAIPPQPGHPAANQAGSPAASEDPGEKALPRIDLTPPPENPPIKTREGNNPGAPVPGANSFTEAQAKSRIESMGYNVSTLSKDGEGVWRGKADKAGKSFDVSLDFQGNVVIR